MMDIETVERLAIAAGDIFGSKFLKVKDMILVQTDSVQVADLLIHIDGVIVEVCHPEKETPPSIPPQPTVGEGDEAVDESWETVERGEGADDPAEGGKPRKVCRNCMRLFYSKHKTAKCCCAKCSVGYAGRSRHIVAIEQKYQYKNQHRHWFYGDEEWFNARLASGSFHENGRVITPEGHLRIIRFSGGHWTYDEVATS